MMPAASYQDLPVDTAVPVDISKVGGKTIVITGGELVTPEIANSLFETNVGT